MEAKVIYRGRTNVDENRILDCSIIQVLTCDYKIDEAFYKDNGSSEKELERTFTLSRTQDYIFNAWFFGDDSKIKVMSFTFDCEHPLYVPLLHLINYDEELVIDDDETRELNKKYMRIYKDGEVIKIDFVNELEDDMSFDKFNVFIKNIVSDGRSKVDHQNLDTRERLNQFFNETFDRQITLEQYCAKNHIDAGFSRIRAKKEKEG